MVQKRKCRCSSVSQVKQKQGSINLWVEGRSEASVTQEVSGVVGGGGLGFVFSRDRETAEVVINKLQGTRSGGKGIRKTTGMMYVCMYHQVE